MKHKQTNERPRGGKGGQIGPRPGGTDDKKSSRRPSSDSRPAVDKVEQASIESFPASDPPGYGTGHA